MSLPDNLYGTRQTLVRLAVIYGFALHGRTFNCSTVAAELEVSTKTVQRDIELLRDGLGIPLVFNFRKSSYEFHGEHALPWWLHRPAVLPPEVRVPTRACRRVQEAGA